MCRGTRIGFIVVSIMWLASGCGSGENGPPYSPEEALKTFQLPDEFEIELVAAEPNINDPVAIDFDPNGRMYVVQMTDYPSQDSAVSSIVLLEDRDNDGRYESSTVFAEELAFVNGVMCWNDGVLATVAPDIIYLKDTTGDGKADVRRVVLSGFAATNPQLRMSSIRYGLDNWIYGAYPSAGGSGRYPQFSDHGEPLHFQDDPQGRRFNIYPATDFRFHPDSLFVEPSGGFSQFGLTFDDAANRFAVWNNKHVRHVVIDSRYLTRNPNFNAGQIMASVPDHGDASPVFSIARNALDLHESEIGHFTSACGLTVYTGGIFPGPYAASSFVCEPVSNLLHVDLLTDNGVTFSGARHRQDQEFLASTDSWFRPVNTAIGPDGALYVVDFYRFLVEHPAWIPRADEQGIYTHAGVLQEADFLKGHDLGRIYRIVPKGFDRSKVTRPALLDANKKELVAALQHSNRWWRITAQRLLLERKDRSAIPLLERLVTEGSPVGRIHALWTLQGFGVLSDDQVLGSLEDSSAMVRRQGVLLAEQRLHSSSLRRKIVSMVNDPDIRVQFQVALTFTVLPHGETFEPLKKLATQHLTDHWFQTAILLNATSDLVRWFKEYLQVPVSGDGIVARKKMSRSIAVILGNRQIPDEVSSFLSFIAHLEDTASQSTGLRGLYTGLTQRGGAIRLTARAQDDLLRLASHVDEGVRDAALDVASQINLVRTPGIRTTIRTAIATAVDASQPDEIRGHATRVAGLDPAGPDLALYDKLLRPQQPADVQMAAARVLLAARDTAAISILLSRWESYTAEVRDVVEKGFLYKEQSAARLVQALVSGKVKSTWLSATARTRLMQHRDPNIRRTAREYLSSLFGDREKIVNSYHESTILKGDIANGKAVFESACSVCHKVTDQGNEIGPDLRSVSNRTKINLLAMILNPNADISPGYDGYMIETKDGRSLAGIMVNESPALVVLRAPGGAEHTVPRSDIENIKPMDSSIMPEGLETSLTIQEMSDLLEFIQTLGKDSSVR